MNGLCSWKAEQGRSRRTQKHRKDRWHCCPSKLFPHQIKPLVEVTVKKTGSIRPDSDLLHAPINQQLCCWTNKRSESGHFPDYLLELLIKSYWNSVQEYGQSIWSWKKCKGIDEKQTPLILHDILLLQCSRTFLCNSVFPSDNDIFVEKRITYLIAIIHSDGCTQNCAFPFTELTESGLMQIEDVLPVLMSHSEGN